MTLTLPYLTTTLAFDTDTETDQFLTEHDIAIYIDSAQFPQPHPPAPLHERIWDCKKSQMGCTKALDRYRVVDLKGQVD